MSGNHAPQINRRQFLGTAGKGLLVATLVPLGFPLPAAANAPKEVKLSYDTAARSLTVQINHSSAAPTFHYIDVVEIKKGGKPFSTTEYTKQPDQAIFSYVYPVDAAPGDLLEVKVGCSIFGSKTEKLTVK